MSDSYIINDPDVLAYHVRQTAALTLTSSITENLDEYITLDQIVQIIINNGDITNNGTIVLDEQHYDTILDEVIAWIYNSGLAKLAAKDHIECAWDSDSDSMIFWATNQDKKHSGGVNNITGE